MKDEKNVKTIYIAKNHYNVLIKDIMETNVISVNTLVYVAGLLLGVLPIGLCEIATILSMSSGFDSYISKVEEILKEIQQLFHL